MKDLILYNIFIKIIIILIFNWLSYKILQFCVPKEHDLYKYKIKYFTLNLITSISSIILFLILIFVVRTRFLDKDIDLYLLFLKYKLLISPLSYLNLILVSLAILSLIFFFAILVKEIQEYLLNQIIKRYLYTFFGTPIGANFINSIQEISLLNLIVFKLSDFIKKIASKTNTEKYITNKGQQQYLILFNICQFIAIKLPTILILIYFIYELIFNKGILSSKFNSWLFMYLLYGIYKRITNYVTYSDNTINEMVFNMYYRDRSIKYVNMPEDWKNLVYKYVDNGLYWTSKEAEEFCKTIGLINFFDGMFWKYSWISTDGYIYSNNNNEEFFEENNDSIDIVHYPYDKHNTSYEKK